MRVYREYQLKNGKILVVRSAEKEDAQEELDMYKQQCCETPFLSRGPNDVFPTVESFVECYEDALKNDKSCYVVAIVDEKIIGSGHIEHYGGSSRVRHKCDVDLGILKDYWGLGIGGKIMQTLLEVAEKVKLEQVELSVASQNERAIKMYESFGFEKFGTMPNSWKYEDGTYQDLLIMVKFFQK